MAGTIELDGERYDRGSTEHLEKIDSLHKSEISKQTEAYVQYRPRVRATAEQPDAARVGTILLVEDDERVRVLRA